jgi:GT2 family glycosyltransferase
MTSTAAHSESPELSVVIVTHGAWSLTEQALAALTAHTQRRFELIVVDNASEDETPGRLSRAAGLRLILNDENRGFGPATNQGAAHARGEYLALLNSDAFVHRGWLEPLLETLAQPGVGATVPRYLHRDGSLQEAGALLACDGTVQLYGDGDDPDKSRYRFRRIVDYGSAVCMLMRRETFAALGGFDDLYAPAYYEDADLCLRLAERGESVVFEPRSTVTHVRYGSGGLDQAVELSERNRSLFVGRWKRRLAGRPASFVGASDQAAIWARDTLATPRFLICGWVDEPGVQRLVRTLLEGWPRGRLTWAIEARQPTGFDVEAWRTLGVELLDGGDPSWLSARLFHYDVVITGAAASDQLRAAVDRTQPQAPRIPLEGPTRAPGALLPSLVPVLAGAGVAPPRHVASIALE